MRFYYLSVLCNLTFYLNELLILCLIKNLLKFLIAIEFATVVAFALSNAN